MNGQRQGMGIATIAMLVVAMVVAFFAFHRIAPGPGEEAVLIEKPMFFGHGGIDPDPITTGATYVARTTGAVMVNMQPQQFNYEVDDLMSSNGIPLAFNAAIRLQVKDPVDLITRFGQKWYDNNVSVAFASRLRQAVRQHDMNSLAIDASGIDDVDKRVFTSMNDYIAKMKLPITLLTVTAGKATPPKEILIQRTETAAQQQRKLTEDSTKLAEDARRAAETSRALADNAYRQTLGLNPQEFVELQRIDMQKKVCDSGKCTFIIGNGTPVVNTGR